MKFPVSSCGIVVVVVSLRLLLLGTAAAFTTRIVPHTPTTDLSAVSIDVVPQEDQFYRAVQLADNLHNSRVDIDELDQLASQLESVNGCQFEEEPQQQQADQNQPDLCDKEIQDRLDVAEILRLQIELQLRLEYLQKANLFADDVRRAHSALERQHFKEALLANRVKSPGGSDLGLW